MAIVEYRYDIFKDGKEEWFAPAYKENVSDYVYDSFEKALIGIVTMKTNNLGADEYIFKMLGMQ